MKEEFSWFEFGVWLVILAVALTASVYADMLWIRAVVEGG